ncbi:MAG: cobalamin-binding protein, partial [Myxococcota bacterium]
MSDETTGPEAEIVLADLADEELTAQMHDDLYDGL